LQDLEILDIQVFRVHIELDLGHGDIHVDTVKNLAESSTRKAVLECVMLKKMTIARVVVVWIGNGM
jgi:hypothetical protein